MAADSEQEEEEVKLNLTTGVKDTGAWAKTVHVSVAVEDVNKEFNSVLGGLSGMVNLPGFRPGKVPRDVVEKRFGADVKKQVTQNLVERALSGAIEKEKLRVIGDPDLDPATIVVEKNKPFEFEFGIEIFPEFEMPNYKGLQAEQEEIDILPEEMETALNNIRERFAEEVEAPADHAVREKDSAAGILRVLVDGAEIHKEEDARLLVMDGHVFGAHAHLGAKYLLGAKAGDKRAVEETLDGKFPVESARGRKATLEFEVKSVKTLKLPEIDAELAKKMNLNDADTLKEKVRIALLEKIGDTIKTRTRETLLNQIVAGAKFEMPERALAKAAARGMSSQLQQMQQMGLSLENIGVTPEKIVADSREHAAAELRRYFILETICEKEHITVEDEEVDEAVVGMAREQNVPAQQLFDKLSQEGQLGQIETSLKIRKAVEFVIDAAEIKVIPRKPFEQQAGHEHTEHAPEHGHSHEHAGHDHGGHAHGEHEHAKPDHPEHEHGAHDHGGHEHGAHDHGAPKHDRGH